MFNRQIGLQPDVMLDVLLALPVLDLLAVLAVLEVPLGFKRQISRFGFALRCMVLWLMLRLSGDGCPRDAAVVRPFPNLLVRL